jgi:hypothetical protein
MNTPLLLMGFILAVSLYAQVPNITHNMARSVQTLNQIDKTQDGELSRNQGRELEERGASEKIESYNTDAHRDYVRERKIQKNQKK